MSVCVWKGRKKENNVANFKIVEFAQRVVVLYLQLFVNFKPFLSKPLIFRVEKQGKLLNFLHTFCYFLRNITNL